MITKEQIKETIMWCRQQVNNDPDEDRMIVKAVAQLNPEFSLRGVSTYVVPKLYEKIKKGL